MTTFLSSTHSAILQKGLLMPIVLLFASGAAQVQVAAQEKGTVVGCIDTVTREKVPCNSGSGGRGENSSGSDGESFGNLFHNIFGSHSKHPSGPVTSPAEAERQRRVATAHYLNEQGNAAYERKDWMTALRAYRQAHELNPDSAAIQQNLAAAQDNLGVEAYIRADWETALDYFREALKNDPTSSVYADNLKMTEANYQAAALEKNRQEQDATTAEQMRGTIEKLSSSVSSTAPTSAPGLDFIDSHPKDKTVGLEFNELRDAPNAAKLEKNSSGATPALTPPNAGDQLKSAEKYGTVLPGGMNDPRNPFDNHGKPNGSLDPVVIGGQGEGQQNSKPVPEVVTKDPRYQALQGEKAKLEDDYQKLSAKHDEIKKQRASGQGKQGPLAVELAKVDSEITHLRSEIATKAIQMDDTAKKIEKENDSVSFTEEKPTTPKEAKPAVNTPGAAKPTPPKP